MNPYEPPQSPDDSGRKTIRHSTVSGPMVAAISIFVILCVVAVLAFFVFYAKLEGNKHSAKENSMPDFQPDASATLAVSPAPPINGS